MSSYVNFYSAQYQNMEYQYLQEAPGIINQVISSIKEEAVSFGTSHPLTNEEIHSKAFKLVRETLPKIETALKDHFKGTAYDLLIRTSMDSVSNQKKRRMVYAPNERDLRKQMEEVLQKSQANFENLNIQSTIKHQQDSTKNLRDVKQLQDKNLDNISTQTKV